MSKSADILKQKVRELSPDRGDLAQVARDMGVPSSTLTKWLKPETDPSISTLDRISDALNIPAHDLIKPPGMGDLSTIERKVLEALATVDEDQKWFILEFIERLGGRKGSNVGDQTSDPKRKIK